MSAYKSPVLPSTPCPEAAEILRHCNEQERYIRALVAAIEADHRAFEHIEQCAYCGVCDLLLCDIGQCLSRTARELRAKVMQ